MSELIQKLMKRWGVDSLWQVVLILFIFAITGMTALYAKKLFFYLLGITGETPFWLRSLVWFVTVIPAYQALFLFYGFILGQFDFVWRFEKQSFRKIRDIFTGGKAEQNSG